MSNTRIQHQTALRHMARRARNAMSQRHRGAASETIAEKVIVSQVFGDANNIACYLPMKCEVNTWRIIERAWQTKKRVFAPVVRNNRLMEFRELLRDSSVTTHKLGMQEPDDGEIVLPQSLDLVITPLVAFDGKRNRIGMGGGYYDRAFSFLDNAGAAEIPLLVGVAFDCQRVEKITPNPWDIRLFRVFTESDDI